MRVRTVLDYLVADTPLPHGERWRSGLLVLLSLALLAAGLAALTGRPPLLALVPGLAASAALLFTAPQSPLAQPWPIIGGHGLSALVGWALCALLPELWLAAPLAAGCAVLLMHATRSFHPPGAATALLPFLLAAAGQAVDDRLFLVSVLAGGAGLVGLGLLFNNGLRGHAYPAHRAALLAGQGLPANLPAHIEPTDLHRALSESGVYIDIGEEALAQILARAAGHAAAREDSAARG